MDCNNTCIFDILNILLNAKKTFDNHPFCEYTTLANVRGDGFAVLVWIYGARHDT